MKLNGQFLSCIFGRNKLFLNLASLKIRISIQIKRKRGKLCWIKGELNPDLMSDSSFVCLFNSSSLASRENFTRTRRIH